MRDIDRNSVCPVSTRPSRSGVIKNNKHRKADGGETSTVGGETSSEWAKRPGGETSKRRNVQWRGETSRGRNVKGAKRPATQHPGHILNTNIIVEIQADTDHVVHGPIFLSCRQSDNLWHNIGDAAWSGSCTHYRNLYCAVNDRWLRWENKRYNVHEAQAGNGTFLLR